MVKFGLTILLGALGFGCPNSAYGNPAINAWHIHDLNSDTNRTWTAGENEFMKDKTEEDIRYLCGSILLDEETDNTPIVTYGTHGVENDPLGNDHLGNDHLDSNDPLGNDNIPDEFDARVKWPDYIHPIRNQKQCGSCWAFSAAEVLTDRFTIATNGKFKTVLSPEDLVSCDKTDMGCMGGQLPSAWRYMRDSGIVTDTCFPYNSGNGTTSPCVTECADSEPFSTSKHRAKNFYQLNTVQDIQLEIMRNGPVQAAFRVYKSFMSYTSGVYQRSWWKVWDTIMGGHAIKIVGWGTQVDSSTNKSVDYWTVANSWDTSWGEQGYFRIKRGVNMCGIESNVYAGLPLIEERVKK